VSHEHALLAFAELELAGQGAEALAPIEAFLAETDEWCRVAK
jgi:hypothetical protein